MAATRIARERRQRDGYFEKYIKGKGADMGCGDDPVLPDSIRYDIQYGKDAQNPIDIEKESLDYVFSSHCLEHLPEPILAFQRWWDLVRPGGHMVISVPDWFLYEQQKFPSDFNHDHKWSFSMFPLPRLPHSKHLVLSDLVRGLDRCQVLSYKLCDGGFNYLAMRYDRTWHDKAEAEIELVCKKMPQAFWWTS